MDPHGPPDGTRSVGGSNPSGRASPHETGPSGSVSASCVATRVATRRRCRPSIHLSCWSNVAVLTRTNATHRPRSRSSHRQSSNSPGSGSPLTVRSGTAAAATVTGSCTGGSLGGRCDAAGLAATVEVVADGVEVDDDEQRRIGQGVSLTALAAAAVGVGADLWTMRSSLRAAFVIPPTGDI